MNAVPCGRGLLSTAVQPGATGLTPLAAAIRCLADELKPDRLRGNSTETHHATEAV